MSKAVCECSSLRLFAAFLKQTQPSVNPLTSFSLLVIVMGVSVTTQASLCSNPLSQYFNGKLYLSQVVSTATDCQQSASPLVKRAVVQY